MSERVHLEARWLEITRTILPEQAAARHRPVRADHCFQRILLDAATDGIWYDAIAGRPAYRAATDDQLRRAVELAEAVANGDRDLPALNTQSLAWRRSRK